MMLLTSHAPPNAGQSTIVTRHNTASASEQAVCGLYLPTM